MLVRSLMTPAPQRCGPRDTLDVAARWMWELDVGALPVVDGRRPVGMLTDRDVCMAAYTQGRPLREVAVGQAMSREVHVVRLDDDALDALRLMAERQVRRLPVVDDDGSLVGLVSLADLQLDVEAGRLEAEALAAALAAITRPRRPALRPLVLEPTTRAVHAVHAVDPAEAPQQEACARRLNLRTRIMAPIVPARAPR